MKIYTKTGDAGTTSLVGGARVSKTHPRVMAYGDADELISHLGILRCRCAGWQSAGDGSDCQAEVVRANGILRRIQKDMMQISAHFAADRKQAKLRALEPEMVDFLEGEIDRLTALLPEQKAFVLPAGPLAAAECHVARTVCRRTERSALMIEDLADEDKVGIQYINRLSDYLFTLARYLCVTSGTDEDYWLP